jgi:hypothetical protein
MIYLLLLLLSKIMVFQNQISSFFFHRSWYDHVMDRSTINVIDHGIYDLCETFFFFFV